MLPFTTLSEIDNGSCRDGDGNNYTYGNCAHNSKQNARANNIVLCLIKFNFWKYVFGMYSHPKV